MWDCMVRIRISRLISDMAFGKQQVLVRQTPFIHLDVIACSIKVKKHFSLLHLYLCCDSNGRLLIKVIHHLHTLHSND